MTFKFEDAIERLGALPDSRDALWAKGRVRWVGGMFGVTRLEIGPDTPGIARGDIHLRLLEQYGHMRDHGHSEAARQAILDVAIEFATETGLAPEVSEANWQRTQQQVF